MLGVEPLAEFPGVSPDTVAPIFRTPHRYKVYGYTIPTYSTSHVFTSLPRMREPSPEDTAVAIGFVPVFGVQ